jgi:hypothetical protein
MALNSTATKSRLKPNSRIKPAESRRRRQSAAAADGSAPASLMAAPPAVSSGLGPITGDLTVPSSLSSAFGVDFNLPPGSHQVMVDSSGKVVEGHLQVFAANGSTVATTSRNYDDETKHQAAAREFRQSQAVGLQSPKLLGHCALLGVEAGKSQAAIAKATGMSRSLISRSAPATVLMDKHPDIALSKSHFEAVLPLEEIEQEQLLLEAAAKKLSVHALEQLIATAHPERRRQQQGHNTLAELVEQAGLAKRFGVEWQQNRRGCVAAVRRLLHLASERAPQLMSVLHGTDEAVSHAD